LVYFFRTPLPHLRQPRLGDLVRSQRILPLETVVNTEGPAELLVDFPPCRLGDLVEGARGAANAITIPTFVAILYCERVSTRSAVKRITSIIMQPVTLFGS
jgi:hypothetical protein